MAPRQPLVVLVGPTASGKTALGIELAKRFDGEIICADSRTVYRGLDIGTAKPTRAHRQSVRHHLLDVVEPDERFSVADFKKLANQAIAEIAGRGKLPLLVGGSGLYIDAVIYNYGFAPEGLAARRDPTNPRHLSRDVPVIKDELRPNTLLLGLKISHDIVRQRIKERVEVMFASGLIDETKRLIAAYGWDIKPLRAPGYKAVRGYLEGEVSLTEAKDQFVRSDLNLVKRQMTWFKRNKSIQWQDDHSKIVEIVTTFLNKIK